jgi:putative Holliday junction resolvase|tara:strand:- start:167 stop:625 length:459 start_codon:yes stop_codon:yes gene_type:complete
MKEKNNNIINKDYLYMGIDFGSKKIGFAIGQLITAKSSPLSIVINKNNQVNWTDIQHLIEKWKPNVIIVGYPYALKKNKFLESLDNFIKDLTYMYKDSIQVSVFSEVLSTEETKELYANIRKSDYNISKKDNLDDLSASIILESWFNENMIS